MTDPQPASVHLLEKIPLFAGFGAAQLEKIAAQAHERKTRGGETLMRTGDPGSFMMLVILGEVRVMLPGISGKEQMIATLGPGAAIGEIALFDGKPRTADIVAVTNGKVLTIERVAVQKLIATDAAFALRVIEILCGRLRHTLGELDGVLFQDVAARLAKILLESSQGKPPRRLDMTQAALGQRAGASREIVNKRLRAWEEAGIVALSPGRITLLDEPRLAACIPGNLP